MKYKDIIVIVPTLNNDLTIQNVVDDILSFGYKVIVIDDGYTNPVSNFLKQNDNVTIIRHEINQGKGQAILTGAKKVKEFGYDYFVSMDGDGQHLAREVHKLLEARNEDEQLIIGSRNFDIDNIPVKSKMQYG